jgi:hypothetical protein
VNSLITKDLVAISLKNVDKSIELSTLFTFISDLSTFGRIAENDFKANLIG